MAHQPPSGTGTKPSRSHARTPHSLGLLWTSDQPDAETCTRHTCPPVGFEPTITASERQQTHTLDRAATAISSQDCSIMKLILLKRKVRIPGNCQGTADGVWRNEVTDLPILNLRIRWEVCVIFLHVPAALNQAERHQYPPNWMLDGPLGWYGRFEISCPYWISNHGSSAFQPVGQFKFVNYYNE